MVYASSIHVTLDSPWLDLDILSNRFQIFRHLNKHHSFVFVCIQAHDSARSRYK
jgi:hypothetical protein